LSSARQEALIDRPPETVWDLLGDPRRHPEWWPKVIEVRGERFEEGDSYAQVTETPFGRQETTFLVDQRDEIKQIRMRCLETGMYADWRLTEAQASTFLDVEMGMDPKGVGERVFDAAAGRLYFRRWLQQAIDGLKAAVEKDG
jgi:Polyketide cyclase / dehydrase and lipid transport